ncbi:hypothetical protein [Shimia ponticola]|uniref:hypothetical protein n=1 Tax=Shimia ponticola TaxID=2582893 RepID=UPI0011BFA982|nr:hypothetical protein [Shimia ponticola]
MTDPKVGNAALVKLEDAPEGGVIEFTKEEAAALRQIVNWWLNLRATALVGGALVRFVKLLAGFVAFIIAIRAGFLEWLSRFLSEFLK